MWVYQWKERWGLRPQHIQTHGLLETTWLKSIKFIKEACDRAGLVDFAELLGAHEFVAE